MAVPTIRQSLEFMEVVKLQNEEDFIVVFSEVISRFNWRNQDSVAVILEQLDSNLEQIITSLERAIMQGFKPSEITKVEKSGKVVDIDLAVLLYAKSTNQDFWKVFNETPFPFFLEVQKKMRGVEAWDKLNEIDAHIIGNGYDKDNERLNKLYDEISLSFYNKKKEDKDNQEPPLWKNATPEEVRKNREKLTRDSLNW